MMSTDQNWEDASYELADQTSEQTDAEDQEREAIRREMAEESGAHVESDEDEGIWVGSPEYNDWHAEFYSDLSEFDDVYDPYEY